MATPVSAVGPWRGVAVLIRYPEEAHYHKRILIRPGTRSHCKRVVDEEAVTDCIWWQVTPEKDVYPEEFAVPPLVSVCPLGKDDKVIAAQCIGPRHYRHQVHDLTEPLSIESILEISDEVDEEIRRLDGDAAAPVARASMFPSGSGLLPTFSMVGALSLPTLPV